MNGYELIMKIQTRMKDPVFAQRFNALVAELNNIPGLQQEVMNIVKISDEKKRKKAMDKLPSKAKNIVQEIFTLINN
ncbi:MULTISPECIES: hypothetical protein [Clostridium]|uniref:Uncharacterized protein n=1 Tax=Clostridium cibarium TaxID=2762247 RepID=A0ABR8PYB9_9CLOT|nr:MULTISPECIES: hypothetical protein [Clostridium]MBD7913161.1 hypothetical protein [Clostridium cibarium]